MGREEDEGEEEEERKKWRKLEKFYHRLLSNVETYCSAFDTAHTAHILGVQRNFMKHVSTLAALFVRYTTFRYTLASRAVHIANSTQS